MKYSELKKQIAAAHDKVLNAQRELEITRNIQMKQLGEVPRGHVVEFRVRQRTAEMEYAMRADARGFKDSIENAALRSLAREISRNGFVSVQSETDLRDRVQVDTFTIRVVRP